MFLVIIGILSTLLILVTAFAIWISWRAVGLAKRVIESESQLVQRSEELANALTVIQQFWAKDPDPLDADIIQ